MPLIPGGGSDCGPLAFALRFSSTIGLRGASHGPRTNGYNIRRQLR